MKRVYWSIADSRNLKYFDYLKNSFLKFHPNEELILFGDEEIQLANDPLLFYRAAPYFTKKLMESGYDWVCKLDCDQIITASLNHIWEGGFDVAVVQNSNPREMKNYLVTVWDIDPLSYINCGLVVMKNKRFVDHWWRLCTSPHFDHYQMREQDLLNIMVFYGEYAVKFLDRFDKWHGLISKGYWAQIELRDNKLILPKNEEWPTDSDKEIICLHYAQGNTPNKWGDINIRFQPEVAKYLQALIK